MENTIIILAEIVYACVVTLKTGKSKVKLHLKDAINQVLHGEEIVSKDIFLFPSQLFDAFLENVPMDVMRLTLNDLTSSLRGAKLMLQVTLTDDEQYTNFSISKMMLQDKGIDDLEEASVMAKLDAKAREKRAERSAANDKVAVKAAMAAMAAEFAALEEPTEAPAETEANEECPELSEMRASLELLATTSDAEAKVAAISKAEAKVAAAEAAYAADPTPAKKGAVTRAKKALAKLQK